LQQCCCLPLLIFPQSRRARVLLLAQITLTSDHKLLYFKNLLLLQGYWRALPEHFAFSA
jgi:hypothetical protein